MSIFGTIKDAIFGSSTPAARAGPGPYAGSRGPAAAATAAPRRPR